MKKLLILCWLICHSLLIHAQIPPDDKNWKAFAAIALSTADQDGQAPVIRKWQSAVHYKIYGSFDNSGYDKTIAQYVEQTFRKLSQLTGIDISSTDDDNQVNLFIVIGRPVELPQINLPQAARHFEVDSANSHCYYSFAENGYTQMLTYINPDDDTFLKDKKDGNGKIVIRMNNAVASQGMIRGESSGATPETFINSSNGQVSMVVMSQQNRSNASAQQGKRVQKLWCKTRLMLMKSLGFNGVTDDTSSLFTNNFSQRLASQKIIASDARIIKALYNPAMKSGMTAQEAFQAGGNLFAK